MKRSFIAPVLFTLFMYISSLHGNAQSPEKMSYQAVIRNAGGTLVTNHDVGMKISILQGSPTGTMVYQEIFTPNPRTNSNGLVTIEIGGGIPVTGLFSVIDWSSGPYFLKTETDPSGGLSYTITGTSQLLSVPYAIYSKFASKYNEIDPVFATSPSNGITGSDILKWNNAYSWGNHSGLYHPISWIPTWLDIPGKPSLATIATSGSYSDLIDKPSMFDGSWSNLTGKPLTLAGFGITDAMTTTHIANGITSVMISNWNTSYTWGNHASAGYIPGNRTITINGTAYDLTVDRSWNIGTVTSVALSMPVIFSVTGSPITSTGTLSASFLSQSANLVFASPIESAGTPTFRELATTDIPNLDWNKITSGKPITLEAYGIIDGVNTTGDQTIAGNKTFTGTTIVPTPINETDATTKAYVDALIKRIEALEQYELNDILNNGYFTDYRDRHQYKVVKIGDQIWMAENLAYLPEVHTNGDFGRKGQRMEPGYGVYGYNGSDVAAAKAFPYYSFGVYYNFWAAIDGCPTGWHLPSDVEWTTLENYLISNGYNFDGTYTNNKIAKSLASSYRWAAATVTGSVGNTDIPEKRNLTGFTALPGGIRENTGTFTGLSDDAFLWSSTMDRDRGIFYRHLRYTSASVNKSYKALEYGLNVRCVKD